MLCMPLSLTFVFLRLLRINLIVDACFQEDNVDIFSVFKMLLQLLDISETAFQRTGLLVTWIVVYADQ